MSGKTFSVLGSLAHFRNDDHMITFERGLHDLYISFCMLAGALFTGPIIDKAGRAAAVFLVLLVQAGALVVAHYANNAPEGPDPESAEYRKLLFGIAAGSFKTVHTHTRMRLSVHLMRVASVSTLLR